MTDIPLYQKEAVPPSGTIILTSHVGDPARTQITTITTSDDYHNDDGVDRFSSRSSIVTMELTPPWQYNNPYAVLVLGGGNITFSAVNAHKLKFSGPEVDSAIGDYKLLIRNGGTDYSWDPTVECNAEDGR